MTNETLTFKRQIGELVKSVRTLKKLSVRQFATLSGVSKETISTLEANGQTQLSSVQKSLPYLGFAL